jgi:signal-transduction protein with cAMP-binding, CBS, and nucleotidyltransferase domain
MERRGNERRSRSLLIDRDVERLKQQLARFQPFLSRKATGASLEDFDLLTQRLIGRIFGPSSEFAEAYEYAKVGEAGSLVNMPEEAQEHGARDVYRESLQQRRQVLESCITKLTTLRTSRVQPTGITGVRVADYMSHDVRSVHKDATLQEAARLLSKWKVGSLLVDDDRRYIGIITDTDLSRKGTAKGLDPCQTTVKTCMSKPVVSIEDDEALTAAIALMKAKAIRHLAVTEDGTIIGVLSVSDLLRAYSELAGLDVEGAEEE